MLRLLSIEGKGIEVCHKLQRGYRTGESLGEIVVLVVEFCFGCGNTFTVWNFWLCLGASRTVFLRVMSNLNNHVEGEKNSIPKGSNTARQ